MTASSSSSAGRPTKRSNESGPDPSVKTADAIPNSATWARTGSSGSPNNVAVNSTNESAARAAGEEPGDQRQPHRYFGHTGADDPQPRVDGDDRREIVLLDEQRPAGVRELLYEPEVHERDSHSDSENRRDIPA